MSNIKLPKCVRRAPIKICQVPKRKTVLFHIQLGTAGLLPSLHLFLSFVVSDTQSVLLSICLTLQGGTDALIHQNHTAPFYGRTPASRAAPPAGANSWPDVLNTHSRRARPDEGKSPMVPSNHWHPPFDCFVKDLDS